MNSKIVIAGASYSAAALASRLVEREYAALVIVDDDEALARALALDLAQGAALSGHHTTIDGGGWEEVAGAGLVVLSGSDTDAPGPLEHDDPAAGLERRRAALERAARWVADRAPDAIVLVATEAVTVTCHQVAVITGFPRRRVIGVGGALASARLRGLLAAELGVSVGDVVVAVLGSGGATVPVLTGASVAGIALVDLLGEGRWDALVIQARELERRRGFASGPGAQHHGHAAAVLELIDAIVRDAQSVHCAVALCQDEYGLDGLFEGVPVRLGRAGVEEILEIGLSKAEREALGSSARELRALLQSAQLDRARPV